MPSDAAADPRTAAGSEPAAGGEEVSRPAAGDEECLFAILRSPLLRALSGSTQQALAGRLKPTMLRSGQLLFRENDFADALYLVDSGRLRVFRTGDDGSESTVAEIGPGELVGEMGLLDGAPRSASVQAVEPTRLWRLDRAGFFALAQSDPGFLLALSELPARRRLRPGASGELQGDEAVAAEMLRTLRRLAVVGAAPPPGQGPQRLRVTVQELAGLVGCSEETAWRVARELQSRGVIARLGHASVWVNRERLLTAVPEEALKP